MDEHAGPSITIAGAELAEFGRQVRTVIAIAYTARNKPAPRLLLDFGVTSYRLTHGTGGSRDSAGQPARPETRKTGTAPGARSSEQPAPTLTVAEAAQALGVSERRVRQLAQHGFIEVRAGARPIRVYADSVAAWQEQRKRRNEENDREAV
ncbi:MAG TPA: helix-turn-helix domain-containing protein [Trebonia sp.]|nr:helix-turn-helix domain-containing protein [Trebonia sp.]